MEWINVLKEGLSISIHENKKARHRSTKNMRKGQGSKGKKMNGDEI